MAIRMSSMAEVPYKKPKQIHLTFEITAIRITLKSTNISPIYKALSFNNHESVLTFVDSNLCDECR